MTKIIAIANHKGGVGKTTAAASIGAALATNFKRVLLVDLDAQANLTECFISSDEQERTIYDALRYGSPLPIVNIKWNLDLVPSSLQLADIDLYLNTALSREYILKDALAPITEEYDYILLDCPPSLGLVTLNAMVAADEVYVPTTAEALPAKGLSKLVEVVNTLRQRLNPSLRITGVIISRWEASNLSEAIEQEIREAFGKAVFQTRIRKNVAIAEAPVVRKDIFEYSQRSNAAKDYLSLVNEILDRE